MSRQKSTISVKQRRQRQAQQQARRQRLLMLAAAALALIIVLAIFLQRGRAQQVALPDDLSGIQMQGSADAPVQIVEFGDFGCPSCRAWHNAGVKRQLRAVYGDQIAFSFRHFPVITPQSPKAAEASQCAAEQNQFWQFHDYMYDQVPPGALGVAQLKTYAGDLGLETAAFNQCLDSGRYSHYINSEIDAAVAAGARGTPTFLVNNRPVSGQLNAFLAAIDAELGQ